MEQLLLHLLGDYITQTDWMANNKTKAWWPAVVHGMVYTIPFWYFLDLWILPALIIGGTHILIDHWRLARFVVFVKNWITNPKLRWIDCNRTGYPNTMPEWLSVWLLIITDNTLHLGINYLTIYYLNVT
jgi:hypothetical protein